jgi:hypothetical protein
MQTTLFQVLTEETPNIDEIRIMLEFNNYIIPSSYTNENIIPNIIDNVFAGEWILTIPEGIINIKLFKGKTSSVDYMLFSGDSELYNGYAGDALCILESTKTSDNVSRNTAVYQRISKFMTYNKMYPESKAIQIMFWIDSNWSETLTQTAILGFRMMDTLNIKLFATIGSQLCDIKDKYQIMPFTTTDSLIQCKNNIPQKKGNQSIRLRRDDSIFYISLKLDKGDGQYAGVISHDPNVGFLSAVLNCIEKIEPGSIYIIENHGIQQKYFDKSPSSKLWYSLNKMNIVFNECTIKTLPELPNRYFDLENEMTEKLCTILCDMISTTRTIFSNHGGCALTCIKGTNCEESVGRKMPRPDIVFEDECKKEILIIEGKLEKELTKGVKQLTEEHLKGFVEILNKNYPSHTIKKGLCITIDNIDNISKYENLEYPVLFALDMNGRFIDLR